MGIHSVWSPSAMDRLLKCPGSAKLCQGIEIETDYASEGTKAHEAAAKLLRGEEVEPLEDEMAEAVEVYLTVVEEEISKFDEPPKVLIEKRIQSEVFDDFGGTPDCVLIGFRDTVATIVVIEFKYGVGVEVEAEGNEQLLTQLILIEDEICTLEEDDPFLFPECYGIVVQPRTYSGEPVSRTGKITSEDLEAFGKLIMEARKQPDRLSAGKHCQFCAGAVRCPLIQNLTKEVLDLEIPVVDPDAIGSEELNAQWIELLQYETALRGQFDKIRSMMLNILKSGGTIPGYKAVASYGHRCWSADDDVIIKKLQAKGLGKKQTTEPKLKSPAQMEKAFKKDIEKFEDLIIKPFRGVQIAPEKDKRAAYVFETVDEQFEIDIFS